MTYCVALNLDDGMVFASDTRSNAGVDHVSAFTKMFVFEQPDERVLVVLNSGNLGITQGVINILRRQVEQPDVPHLLNVASLYDAAQLVGDAMRTMAERDGPSLSMSNIDASASFLVGGQIRGEGMRLFHVYPQGNFIESSLETPYFQIGESKYGKPIIDRVVRRDTSLTAATKCVLISFDSTMKSNLSVGLPIDLLQIRGDTFRVGLRLRIGEDDSYFSSLHRSWGEGLRQAFQALPDPVWPELDAVSRETPVDSGDVVRGG